MISPIVAIAGRMKIVCQTVGLSALGWLMMTPFAQAAATDEAIKGLGKAGGQAGLSNNVDAQAAASSLPLTIGRIISAALALVGVVILAFTVYAGFLWLTAQGNEEQVKKAKDILKNAVIGAVITFAAYAISSFVVLRVMESVAP